MILEHGGHSNREITADGKPCRAAATFGCEPGSHPALEIKVALDAGARERNAAIAATSPASAARTTTSRWATPIAHRCSELPDGWSSGR